MALRHIATRGYSTGSNGGTAVLVVTRGYGIAVPSVRIVLPVPPDQRSHAMSLPGRLGGAIENNAGQTLFNNAGEPLIYGAAGGVALPVPPDDRSHAGVLP